MHFRAALCLLMIPSIAWGQAKEPDKAPEADVREIVVSPAAAPKPALRYPLLPEVRDLKPGNAALVYLRANSPDWTSPQFREQAFGKIDWFAGPLSTFPKAEAEKVEKQCTTIFKEIDLAARRSDCTWELTDRIRSEGAWLLLPEVQGLRQLGQLEGLKARRALAEQRFDDAQYAIQSGYALSRHVAETPILINCLVGMAIANMTSVAVEDWVQQPNAPNLYWSLTDLPAPFISLRRAYQGEKLLVDNIFPGAREALADPKIKWVAPSNAAATLASLAQANVEGGGGVDTVVKEAWTALMLQREAREYLAKRGRTDAQLDAMDNRSIVTLYQVARYDEVYDEIVKWTSRPFWQANPGMAKAFKELEQSRKSKSDAMGVASVLLPALNSVIAAQARLERKIAVLRSIEAIRLHAATQTPGKLPERWADLGDLPVPLDPMTGQPFDYRVENGRGILSVPALPTSRDGAIVYHISLAKK